MGLNQTLDRLKAEREESEARMLAGTASADDVIDECEDLESGMIASLAERVFFYRMLKDINPGMGEDKIDAMIDRSVMIAEKLYNKLYR